MCTEVPLAKAKDIDAFCHANGIAFIRGDVRGVFGSLFCDFGPSFDVLDVDGEEPHTCIIASISNDATPLVTCVDDERVELQDGQRVLFTEVKGMTELNDGVPRRIKNVKAHSFELEEDTTAYSQYTGGGIATQVKETKKLAFKTLAAAMEDPGEFLLSDFAKLDRSAVLHVGFNALDAFAMKNGRLPTPGSDSDAAAVVACAKDINDAASPATKIDDVDPDGVLTVFAKTAAGYLSPMCAMFGGVIGQEVVKACTGKFHPLHQWFYFDSIESLPAKETLTETELAAEGSRYDSQIACFGKTIQRKIESQKIFLVGAGALGCEFIKNFALMGLSCGADGKVTVTDDDVIEKSNLSRQFLFRDWNIGQAKSTCATNAAKAINGALNVDPLQNRVSPDTEDVFDDDFWQGLDVVVNALDNVNARLYVDSRCVYFGKPLLESGTLGTKCNTQMVIPHWTENYGASRDPPEKEAPACALHNFPHNIDHCLVLGHSEFVGNFETQPADATDFLAKGGGWVDGMRGANESDATILEKLRGDQKTLCGMSGGVLDLISPTYRSASWEGCVGWARRKFESYFASRIKQLLHNCPPDMKTQTGVPFWSPPKRLPKPLAFDAADPLHMQFVVAAANLRAFALGVAPPADCRDAAAVAALLASSAECVVPPFTPTADLTIETGVKEEDERRKALAEAQSSPEGQAAASAAAVDELTAAKASLPGGFVLKANEFEKDDDTNHHMDFISAVGNLRVRCAILGQFWRNHAAITAQFSDTADVTPLRRATTGSRRLRSSRRS